MDLNEMINKSLDEIDALTDEFSKSKATEVEEDSISKAREDEDLSAGDVSEDAPEDAPEEGAEEGAPEEGDEPESSNEDVDSDAEGEEDSAEDEEVEKSLEEELKGDDSVRKALEVSEFLDNLVKGLSTHIQKHNEGLSKSLQSTENSNQILAKSLLGITKSQRAVMEGQSELMKSVRTLNKRLKAIEEQPLVRKSVAGKNTQAINKSFDASAGNKATSNSSNQLSKSEISAKLTSAWEAGNKDLMNDVLSFEGSGGDINALSQEARNILGF